MKAIRANIGICKASPLLLVALSVAVAGCSGSNNGPTASTSPAALTASTFSADSAIQSSETIIALDPVNQAIWVPSYTLDANGNLQYELISTAAAVSNGTATGSKSVSLAGCDTPIGIAYAASISAFLVECGNSSTMALYLSAVDAKSLTVTPIAAPGLTWIGNYGGIIVDPQHNQAVVAGSQNVGLMPVPAGGTPSFNASSVTTMPYDPNTGINDNVIGMAMNFTTQQVAISSPVRNIGYDSLTPYPPYDLDASTVNATAPALNISQLTQPGNPYLTFPIGTFQGAAFDSATNVLALAGDYNNFNYLDFAGGQFYGYTSIGIYNMVTFNNPSAPTGLVTETVNGFEDYYVGRLLNGSTIQSSAGGLAALNPATHQALIADVWGPNLLLVQLPTTTPSLNGNANNYGSTPTGGNGNLDNNGQPSPVGVLALTPPDATSAYAIAQTLVSSMQTMGTSAQLNAIGNPSALAIDQANNIAYILADNSVAPHAWTANAGVTLALVSVDLSAPVYGACPSPNYLCPATWNPRTAQAVVP